MMTAAAFIAVVMTALMTLTVVMAALMTLTVMMAMVVTCGVRIIFQRSISKGFCSSICRSLNACIKPDPDIRKRHLCSHADTSADQRVGLYCLQEARKSAVSASVGINDLLIKYSATKGCSSLSFRAHPTSYPTGSLQSTCFTIPYATAYCPPMTDIDLWRNHTIDIQRKQEFF